MKTQSTMMTYAEMEAAYDGEWVLIDDPELTDMNGIIRGTVLAHSKSREAVYREAAQRNLSRVAILYIGAPPADVDFLL